MLPRGKGEAGLQSESGGTSSALGSRKMNEQLARATKSGTTQTCCNYAGSHPSTRIGILVLRSPCLVVTTLPEPFVPPARAHLRPAPSEAIGGGFLLKAGPRC